MIKTQILKTNSRGQVLIQTYSTNNVYIKKVGTSEIYTKAIDVYGSKYTYEETDILIPVKEEEKVKETIKEE